MEVDDDDSFESEYRVQIGDQVKYLVISPKTFDRDTLSFPIQSLPNLPWCGDWTVAHISRDEITGDLRSSFSTRTLTGVKCQWHPTLVNCLELKRTQILTALTFEALSPSALPTITQSSSTIIAKIARFDWEIPRIDRETRAYQLLEGSGLAPRFLGHIHENGRIIGFLLERVEGRPASIQDLDICETVLKRLHQLGYLHGDANRFNFLIAEEGVKLIDFERLQENVTRESMHKELASLRAELTEESGRGGGFIFHSDDD